MLGSRVLPILVGAALALRAADYLHYADSDRVLRILRLAPRHGEKRESYYKRFDPLFATFPFLWSWCDVFAATIAARAIDHLLAYVALVLFVGGRLRALQEASHTATHSGLCRSRAWQWQIANVMSLYPSWKPDMHHRFIYHVTEHHRHANELDLDPNITRFIGVGMVPGLTRVRFHWKLLHPFSFAGFKETFVSMWINATRKNETTRVAVVRALTVAATIASFLAVGGLKGLAFGYAIPLVTAYPFYSWISVLAEHRWFVRCDEDDRVARECVNGRPTDYFGVGGWLVKHTIFPGTDHHHLAHSLYPHLRWNYLAAVDRALKEREPRYARHASRGLLFGSEAWPSALSELRDRLTSRHARDLAPWTATIGKPRAPSEPPVRAWSERNP